MTWESPILKTLSELPIAPGVPYHSIVANLFPGGPPGLWTDGVVSYESAHLDGAESEVMIRHNHFANDTPGEWRRKHGQRPAGGEFDATPGKTACGRR